MRTIWWNERGVQLQINNLLQQTVHLRLEPDVLVCGAADLFQKAVKVGRTLGAAGPELHALMEHRVARVVHTRCPQTLGTLVRLQSDTSTLSVNLYMLEDKTGSTSAALYTA